MPNCKAHYDKHLRIKCRRKPADAVPQCRQGEMDDMLGESYMALTNNNLEIIKALANNDIHAARKAALASLIEDTSKKNAWAVDYYKKMLTGNASVLMSNLPDDMKTFLVGEAPGGFDEARYFVRENEAAVVSDIEKMKLIADEMSARRIPYRNTTLLYGESGTGKTEFGKYAAHKLDLPFFYVSFSSLIDSYMGSTAKNIHKIFEFCNSIPCVLMLDEFDCIATKRSINGSRGVDGEIERTTISIMQELDRLPNHVVLIAATNRLDMLDEALIRRFSIRHKIEDMSPSELRAMVEQYVKATGTEKYVDETVVADLVNRYHNPGQLMPELVRIIGKNIFEDKKDEILEQKAAEDDRKVDAFEVTYTWQQVISAQTKEDAIAIARKNRSYGVGAGGKYSAKRAEFI